MPVSVYSTEPDGTGGVWLDQLGVVSGWSHTVTFPGGDTEASFNFAADTVFTHPAVRPGRTLQARAGSALVWRGRLDEPDRSQAPWRMAAVGQAYLAREHIVTTAGSTLNTVVDAAIATGLPWTRPATLTSPTAPIAQFGSVDDALGQLANDSNLWSLDVNGVVSTPAYPSGAATLTVNVTDLPSRTLESYANVAVVGYTNTGGGVSVTTVTASTTELTLRGRVETYLDVTGSGSMTLTAAQAAGAALLQQSAVATWSGPFVAGPGALFTLAGGPVDPATVRPGVVVRVMALHADDMGATSVDVPIGQVVYDDATGSAQLLALAAAPNTLLATLARRAQSLQAA